MEFEIVKWYGERKIVTHVHGFENAYAEYINTTNCDTVQVFTSNPRILIAQA